MARCLSLLIDTMIVFSLPIQLRASERADMEMESNEFLTITSLISVSSDELDGWGCHCMYEEMGCNMNGYD